MRLHNTFLLFIFAMVTILATSLTLFALSGLTSAPAYTQSFSALASISYALIFLTPLLLSYLLIKRIASPITQGSIAIAVTTLMLLTLLGDLYIFSLYGFHINGFVLNILITPGGIESLGGESSTFVSGAAVSLACFILISILWLVSSRLSPKLTTGWRKGLKIGFICLFLLSTVSEKVAYGFAILDNDQSILTTAEHYPLYMRTSFRKFAKSMGYSAEPRRNLSIALETVRRQNLLDS